MDYDEMEMWVYANWIGEEAFEYADQIGKSDEYEEWRESFDDENEDGYIGTPDGIDELLMFFSQFGPVTTNFHAVWDKCNARIEEMNDHGGTFEEWFEDYLD